MANSMTSSEKFCLKWNDFQKNVSSSFQEIREDFCDVTLAAEGNQQITAHKVILAASSNFFKEILRNNPHQHPLIYMRGIKGIQLAAVVDFMYQGEVNIAQEDLNDFLIVAEELQLKGLTGNEQESQDILQTQNQSMPQNLRKMRIAKTPKQEYSEINDIETLENIEPKTEERNFEGSENNTVVAVNTIESKFVTAFDELDAQILAMMNHSEGLWSCTQCGKLEKKKHHMKNHIEGKHINGVSHPCNQCGKQFRSRNSLAQHISQYHRIKN